MFKLSTAVGETGVVQGACPMLALKRAVEAARAEAGQEGWFPFCKFMNSFTLMQIAVFSR